MESSFEAPYFNAALGELTTRAESQNLRVDSAATQALKTEIHRALTEAGEESVVGPLSAPKNRDDFNKTIAVLAMEATKAAQADNAEWIQPEHIELAVNELQAWDFWPFKGD